MTSQNSAEAAPWALRRPEVLGPRDSEALYGAAKDSSSAGACEQPLLTCGAGKTLATTSPLLRAAMSRAVVPVLSLSLDLSLLTLQQQACGLLLSPRPLLALKAGQLCVKAHPVLGRTLMACLSLQELHQKRAQKASEAKRLAEEELALVKESRRVAKKKPAKHASARNVSPASSVTKANNAGESLLQVPDAFGAVRDMRGKEEDGGAVLTLGSCFKRAGCGTCLRTVWFLQRPISTQ